MISGGGDAIRVWDLATGRELRKFPSYGSVAISPDGKTVLSGIEDATLRLWEVATGREIRKFEGHLDGFPHVAISPDGTVAFSGSGDGTVRLWDLATGREIWQRQAQSYGVLAVAISPDCKTALSDGDNFTVALWDLATGHQIRRLIGHTGAVTSVVFSPDGMTALSGSEDKTARLWDLVTGREIRKYRHSSGVNSAVFSPDGKSILSASNRSLTLWDLLTGREIRKFEGHSSDIHQVAISPDGAAAISASSDGTIRLWDLKRGEVLVSLLTSTEGDRLAITPKGFFATSRRNTGMLAIARGFEVTSIEQVHQSLFNPDLVREALAQDPADEVARAAEVISLDKVIGSGPAPTVEIISQPREGKSTVDLVAVAARIKDRGKGIGRIEWRVNDITVAVGNAPKGVGPVYQVRQEIALDPGDNTVEVVAYNASNLLASLPAQTTIAYTGPADTVKPKLHLLAIGINNYVDQGGLLPDTGEVGAFSKLTYAVPDAVAIAEEMKKAAHGLYGEVRVRTALDGEATLAGLDRIVQEMAAEITPRDTFILFVAAHGYAIKRTGQFYLIPQDYQGGPNPEALAAGAIGQVRLQDWVSNRIKAKKALILLDTCRSGALTSGYARSRFEEAASDAAVGRLHEATGRPILTAAAAGEDAQETDKLGHGVFTTALIHALHNADTDGDGLITVSELAAYVEDIVPKLAAGGEVRSAVAERSGLSCGDSQSARFGSTGSDFAIAATDKTPKEVISHNRCLAERKQVGNGRVIPDCNRVIELDQNSALFHNKRCWAYNKERWYDRAIPDCNRSIELNQNYASAFINRGNAFRGKGELDRAIADYDRAIELNPGYTLAYMERGIAFDGKGEFDRGIADYSRAIELNPGYPYAYANRGWDYETQGDFEKAAVDTAKAAELDWADPIILRQLGIIKFINGHFKDASTHFIRYLELKQDHVQLEKEDNYVILFRYLARARAGEELAAAELKTNTGPRFSKGWPYAVIELYLGQRSLELTFGEAVKPEERCEAHFYSGEWYILRKKPEEAQAALRKAVETCPRYFIEYIGAKAELKRLKP